MTQPIHFKDYQGRPACYDKSRTLKHFTTNKDSITCQKCQEALAKTDTNFMSYIFNKFGVAYE